MTSLLITYLFTSGASLFWNLKEGSHLRTKDIDGTSTEKIFKAREGNPTKKEFAAVALLWPLYYTLFLLDKNWLKKGGQKS